MIKKFNWFFLINDPQFFIDSFSISFNKRIREYIYGYWDLEEFAEVKIMNVQNDGDGDGVGTYDS